MSYTSELVVFANYLQAGNLKKVREMMENRGGRRNAFEGILNVVVCNNPRLSSEVKCWIKETIKQEGELCC